MIQSLDLFTGAELKNAGMNLAIDRANEKHDGWADSAYASLKTYLRLSQNLPFMCETVRDFAHIELGLPQPPSNRAWGGVFQRASREKLIKHVGYSQVTNPRAHMANASTWVAL